MVQPAAGAVHQTFLPAHGRSRAYIWKFSPLTGGRRPRHFHAEPELNLVVSGSATFGVGKKRVQLSAGEFIRFPPGQDHELTKASSDLYLLAVGVDASLSADVARGHTVERGAPLHVSLEGAERRALVRRATDLLEREGADSDIAELWDQSHWLARRGAARSRFVLHPLTARALRRMPEAAELDLAELARELRAHPSEVSRHFHRDLGLTFVRYRARLRLLRFLQLVDAGEQNWTVAAAGAAFGSYSQAHRTFQAELGCSPRAFFGGVRAEMQAAYLG